MQHFLLATIFTSLCILRTVQAQCVTDGYVLCAPPNSQLGGVAPDDFDNSGLWDSLQSGALDPIQGRKRSLQLRQHLAARQDALCCKPTNVCRIIDSDNIPFCYVSFALFAKNESFSAMPRPASLQFGRSFQSSRLRRGSLALSHRCTCQKTSRQSVPGK